MASSTRIADRMSRASYSGPHPHGQWDDDADEVESTDTTEALREAAKKRAGEADDTSDRERLVPPNGLMAVHLLRLVQFDPTLTEPDLLDPYLRFRLLVSIGEIYKWTNLKKGHQKTVHEKEKSHKILSRVVIDEIKHFSVEVPVNIADPKNVFQIELHTSYVNTQDGYELMARAELHLHEIIRAMMVIDVVPLSYAGRVIANLDIEFAFMYGALGFSYSTQLESAAFEPDRDLARCMFPRLALPENRDGEVLQPQPQHAPSFVPWSCPITTHWNESEEQPPSGSAPNPAAAFTQSMQQAISGVLSQYHPINSRAERLNFFRDLVYGTHDIEKHVQRQNSFSSRMGLAPETTNTAMRVLQSPRAGRLVDTNHASTEAGPSGQQPAQQLPAASAEPGGTKANWSTGMFPAARLDRRVQPTAPHAKVSPAPAAADAPTNSTSIAGPSTPLAATKKTKISAPKQIRRGLRRPPKDGDAADNIKEVKPGRAGSKSPDDASSQET